MDGIGEISEVERILSGKRHEFKKIEPKEIVKIMRDFGYKVPEWPN